MITMSTLPAFQDTSGSVLHLLSSWFRGGPEVRRAASSSTNQRLASPASAAPHGRRQALPQDMGVSLNGGTPKTPQNDHF